MVKGASKGGAANPVFRERFRSTNAIIHVLRCFDDDNIIHVDGRTTLYEIKEIIDTELQLKDLEGIEKKITKVEKQAKTDKDADNCLAVLQKLKAHISEGKMREVL